MPELINAIQYYLFMKWFKSAHADLYKKYRLYIIVPTSSYKIEIDFSGIEPADIKRMQQVTLQYYETIAD